MCTLYMYFHVQSAHVPEYKKYVLEEKQKQDALQQSSMSNFTVTDPTKLCGLDDYPEAAAKWMVDRYKPLQEVEHKSFRVMASCLNGKAPKLSRTRMKEIIYTKGATIDNYLCEELKKKLWFSITTDGSHAQTYPILSFLASIVLSIPATSAPSERLFSHAGLTIANDRASLLPDLASELIYLHDAWRVYDSIVGKKRKRNQQ